MNGIKFKGWDTVYREWRNDFSLDADGKVFDVDGHAAPTIVVLKFTGFEDRNGKDICQGDIVTNFGVTNDMRLRAYEVQWNAAAARFSLVDHKAHATTSMDRSSALESEIIGNIYDNPALLK